MHTFTTEELLEYLFQDASKEKMALIQTAIENDWSLKEKLESLSAAKNELDGLTYSPSKNSINNILNYAKVGSAEAAESL